MSQDPLLDKMDALLKKHRGSSQADLPEQESALAEPNLTEENAPPPDAWLPVLTDVVVMGTLPPAEEAAVSEPPTKATAAPIEPAPAESVPAGEPAAKQDTADSLAISDSLAEQLLGELEPKLAALLQDKVARQIRNSLDDTISALLAQLDVNIREIVRDAIKEKLGKS